jgi:uncharacterized repeat protein (TIGR01451 family)
LVINGGPDSATNVAISLTLGSGLTLGTVSCAAAGGASCPSALGASMTLASLPVGGSLSFTVPTSVAAGVSGPLTFSVAVASANDPQSSNNNATASIVAFSADVGVTTTGPVGAVAGGAVADFSAVVSNAGPDTALNVAVTTTISTELTLGAVSCVASGAAVCPNLQGGDFVIPSLPSGSTLTFAMPATVTAGTNGVVSLGVAASVAGDSDLANNSATAQVMAYSANVGVSNTATTNVGAGSTAFFTATVANSGPSIARNVTITTAVSDGFTVGSITCTATGGAACPASIGSSAAVPVLPASSSLIFTVPVAVPTTASGSLTATVTVGSAGDPVGSNNTASATTTVVVADARNGSYYVYATPGGLYSLTLDFNALTYVMSGNGLNTIGAFRADVTGGGFSIAGNARFRIQPDMVIGGFDFGSGVRPFVAARSFVSNLADLAGQEFNLLGINTPVASGSADSRVSSARWNGGTFAVCVDNIVYAFTQCPPGSLWTYALSASGTDGEFTGVDAVHNDTIVFRVAKSGADSVYLRVGTTADNMNRQFRIGVANAAGLTSLSTQGAATDGSWHSIFSTDTSYSYTGRLAQGSFVSDSATLNGLGVTGPTGLRIGTLVNAGAAGFVTQNSTLSIAVGARNSSLAGFIQIGAK